MSDIKYNGDVKVMAYVQCLSSFAHMLISLSLNVKSINSISYYAA